MFIYVWACFIGPVLLALLYSSSISFKSLSLELPSCSSSPTMALTFSQSESSNASLELDILAIFCEGPRWEFKSLFDSALDVCGTLRYNEASEVHVDVPAK